MGILRTLGAVTTACAAFVAPAGVVHAQQPSAVAATVVARQIPAVDWNALQYWAWEACNRDYYDWATRAHGVNYGYGYGPWGNFLKVAVCVQNNGLARVVSGGDYINSIGGGSLSVHGNVSYTDKGVWFTVQSYNGNTDEYGSTWFHLGYPVW